MKLIWDGVDAYHKFHSGSDLPVERFDDILADAWCFTALGAGPALATRIGMQFGMFRVFGTRATLLAVPKRRLGTIAAGPKFGLHRSRRSVHRWGNVALRKTMPNAIPAVPARIPMLLPLLTLGVVVGGVGTTACQCGCDGRGSEGDAEAEHPERQD